MDKIREEFEKDFSIDCVYKYDGKSYPCENLENPAHDQKVDVTTLNRILHGYRSGHKSRDKEVRELKAFKKIYYPLLESENKKAEQLEAEIKKLRDALEEIINNWIRG